MTIKKCPACSSPAAIRCEKDSRRHCFRVWVECGQCGRKTRDFKDMQEPSADSCGGYMAILAWNSGDVRTAESAERNGGITA